MEKNNKKRNSVGKRLPKYLKKDEVKRLISSARTLRDKVALEIMYTAGLRVSELCNLDVEDIDFGERTILVRAGKGDKDRTVAVPESALQDIRFYLDGRTTGPLIKTRQSGRMTPRRVQQLVKETAKAAGFGNAEDITPHKLRHSHAVHALQAGVNLRALQKQLGHSHVLTTEIYTDLTISEVKKQYQERRPFDL
jgi:site-specific recombinase XerD